MKPLHRSVLVSISCISAACLLNSCGGATGDTMEDPTIPGSPMNYPGTAPAPAHPQNLGATNFSCKGGYQQQQQSPYQQQESCKGDFRFEKSKVSDLNVKMDCDEGVVTVRNNGSPDQKGDSFPIHADGTVEGRLQYQQKIKGFDRDQDCWIEYVVDFDGKADCDDHGKDSLKLKTSLSMAKTSSDKLKAAGISIPEGTTSSALESNGDSPDASPSPSPSPSHSAHPSHSPSPTPSASESSPEPWPSVTISSSPEPWPTHTPEPTHHPHPPQPHPTLVPVVVCQVEEPCEMSSETDFSCPDQQE